MATIQRYTAQVGLNVGGSFNAPNTPRRPSVGPINVPFRSAQDGTGRALEALGGAITDVGLGVQQLHEVRQATADASWFSKARAQASIDWMRRETALQQNAGAPPVDPQPGLSSPGFSNGFEGYTQTALAEFDAYRAEVMASAPTEKARQTFQEWSDGMAAQIAGRAFEFEQQSLFAQRADDFNTAMDAHVQTVFANPDDYDTILSRAEDDLAGASIWMTPEQEIEARRKIETSLQLARAKKLATFEPLRFQEEVGLAVGPVMGTAAKIIGAESGGRADAKNPKSTASGVGQFIDSTWVATVRKHRPDLDGLSDKELIALKGDPDLGREMTIAFTEDNINGLIAVGLDPDEGSVYLAHFAGLEGAKLVLTADENVRVRDILGNGVIKANDFAPDMTVGELKQWAAAKMAGTTPANLGDYTTNPRYSRLTPDQIFALAKDADSAIVAQHSAAIADRKAVYDSRFNGLMLGIHDGQAGMADIEQARSEGWLYSYQDIKKATDAVTARDKDAINTAQALARFSDVNEGYNPFVADDRQSVNVVYKAMGGSVGLTDADPVAVQRGRGIIERTNIVPDDMVTALQAGIRSRDMGEMAKSFQVMDGLRRAYPDATSRAFDAADIARMDIYQGLVDKVQPEELAAWLDPNMDPSKRKRLDDLHAEGLDLAADVEIDEILSAFDESWVSDPNAPFEAQQERALRQDFEELVAFRYSYHGDIDLAKEQAVEALQTEAHWGVTDVGTDLRIMKFPPERGYPTINGDHDYLGDQIEEVVRGEVGTRMAGYAHGAISTNAQSWGVVATQETEAAMQRGELPPYQVVYVDNDGVLRTILGDDGLPELFKFDYAGELEQATERARESNIEQEAPTRPVDTDLQKQLWGADPAYTTGGRF